MTKISLKSIASVRESASEEVAAFREEDCACAKEDRVSMSSNVHIRTALIKLNLGIIQLNIA